MSARGTLALSVLVVIVFGGMNGWINYRTGERIADAQKESAERIARSQKESTDALIRTLTDAERKSTLQHDTLAANQRLANCMNSYDFAARQRLRARAEAGELNLDAWCNWMNALHGAIERR